MLRLLEKLVKGTYQAIADKNILKITSSVAIQNSSQACD